MATTPTTTTTEDLRCVRSLLAELHEHLTKQPPANSPEWDRWLDQGSHLADALAEAEGAPTR